MIDFIEDKQLGFHLGNVVKYVARAGKKDPAKTLEDLKKARWYLDRKIQSLEHDAAGTFKMDIKFDATCAAGTPGCNGKLGSSLEDNSKPWGPFVAKCNVCGDRAASYTIKTDKNA